MGWFPELQRYLEDPWAGFTQHPKALFLWAMRATESKQGIRFPYMSVANRRRIWYVCDQIVHRFNEMLFHRPTVVDPVADEISDGAWSAYLPLVAHPVATVVNAPSDTFWLCDWKEMRTEMIVETFWDADGSMMGMSVAPRGKRRLGGMDDSEHVVRKVTAIIPNGEWIQEIVLHIPRLRYIDCHPPIEDMTYLYPKGITVYYLDSPPLEIGDVGPDLCQRLYRPQKDAAIVGVKGQIGVVNGHRRIIRFGIIQAPSPDLPPDKWVTRYLEPTEHMHLWAAPLPRHDGCLIWDLFDLDMRTYTKNRRHDKLSYVAHNDLVPLEVFFWAKTSEECQSLVALSATHVKVHDGAMPPHMRNVTACIGSLRAEYTAQSGLEPRQIGGVDLNGQALPTDDIRKFDINGPGGEYIARASVSTYGYGLELATNVYDYTSWRYDDYEGDRGIQMGAENHVGVGVAVSFGIDQPSGRTIMKVGALLTLPRSTVGETMEWNEEDCDVYHDWDIEGYQDDLVANLPAPEVD